MWYKRGMVETFLPLDAASIQLVGSAAAWGWPAHYTEIEDSTAAAFLLCSAQVEAYYNLVSAVQGVLRVGIGAADAEVEIARGVFGQVGGSTQVVYDPRTIPFSPYLIPAGTRVAAEIACASAVAVTVYIYLQGYFMSAYEPERDSPLVQANIDAGRCRGISGVIPDMAWSGVITGGAAGWNWGNYTEIEDAVASDFLLTDLTQYHGAPPVTGDFALEIATGAASAEVPRAIMPFPRISTSDRSIRSFPRPTLIKSGERIAARVKATGATLKASVILTGTFLP